MKIFKCEAYGDVVYTEAIDQNQAQAIFDTVFGEMPKELLTWSIVDKLPEGEELLWNSATNSGSGKIKIKEV